METAKKRAYVKPMTQVVAIEEESMIVPMERLFPMQPEETADRTECATETE